MHQIVSELVCLLSLLPVGTVARSRFLAGFLLSSHSTRAPMRMPSPCWRNPTPLKRTWLKYFLTWRRKPKGTRAWKESAVREAPAPKMLCKLGRIRLALDWANVRRLVVDGLPEDDGAITSAWSERDIGYVSLNASFRRTRSDRANRRTTGLRTEQGKAGTSGSPTI
jgi:hypothetical protein